MILRRRVALGGVQLDGVDDRIVISGIEDRPAVETVSAQATAMGYGQRVTEMRRDYKEVAVRFRIWATKDDMAARSEVLEKANKWAYGANGGGYLTLGHRPGRRLRVVLFQAAAPSDIYNWTDEYTIVFRAYGVPFWEDDTETYTFGRSAATGQFSLTVPGNTETVCDISVLNVSGATINNLEVTVYGQQMEFKSLGMGGNQRLNITHIDTGKYSYLDVTLGNSSALRRRTGAWRPARKAHP